MAFRDYLDKHQDSRALLMGIFWRLGAGSATPFDRQQIALGTTEAMFWPELRKALATGPLATVAGGGGACARAGFVPSSLGQASRPRGAREHARHPAASHRMGVGAASTPRRCAHRG